MNCGSGNDIMKIILLLLILAGCTGDNIPYNPCDTVPELRPPGIKCR